MKKLIALVFLLNILALPMLGQDWQVIPDSTSSFFFKDNSGALLQARLDSSFKGSAYSEHYFAHTVEISIHPSVWCIGYPDGNLVFGDPLIQTDTSFEYNFKAGKLIFPLNRITATSYFMNDTIRVNRVLKTDTTINGIQDSIIHFEIKGSPLNRYYRGSLGKVILTKNHGVLFQRQKMLDLPGNGYNALHDISPVLTKVPRPNLNTNDFNNFQVGDEFQFEDKYEYYDLNTSYESLSLVSYKILSKSIVNQSYQYSVRFERQYSPDSLVYGVTNWNLPLMQPELDSISYRLTKSHHNLNTFSVWYQDWNSMGRDYVRYHRDLLLNHNDSCLARWNDNIVIQKIMVEGLGTVYESSHNKSSGTVYSHVVRLIYYKKGTEIWGIKQNLEIREAYIEKLELFPSITTDIINFPSRNRQTFTILHVNGAISKSGLTDRGINTLDVTDLHEGLYILRLKDGSTARFIKH